MKEYLHPNRGEFAEANKNNECLKCDLREQGCAAWFCFTSGCNHVRLPPTMRCCSSWVFEHEPGTIEQAIDVAYQRWQEWDKNNRKD